MCRKDHSKLKMRVGFGRGCTPNPTHGHITGGKPVARARGIRVVLCSEESRLDVSLYRHTPFELVLIPVVPGWLPASSSSLGHEVRRSDITTRCSRTSPLEVFKTLTWLLSVNFGKKSPKPSVRSKPRLELKLDFQNVFVPHC